MSAIPSLLSRSLSTVAVLFSLSASAMVEAAVITPDWQPSVHSYAPPGPPSGTATVNGSAIAMNIVGGVANHSNYLRLFSRTSSELAFPEAEQAIRFSVSGLSFESAPVNASGSGQVLYFTLSNTPDAIPYKSGATGMQQAISLSITASGAYSLGWVTGASGELGWISSINNSGRTGTSTSIITGFDLVISSEHYNLTLYTTGDSIELNGVHGLSEEDDWGDMGVSLTLKKVFAGVGGENRLTAHIDHLELESIPEPGNIAMILGGAALLIAGHKWRKPAKFSE